MVVVIGKMMWLFSPGFSKFGSIHTLKKISNRNKQNKEKVDGCNFVSTNNSNKKGIDMDTIRIRSCCWSEGDGGKKEGLLYQTRFILLIFEIGIYFWRSNNRTNSFPPDHFHYRDQYGRSWWGAHRYNNVPILSHFPFALTSSMGKHGDEKPRVHNW